MVWTPPKTWSNEPLIAGDMNTHLRDNLSILKDPPSDAYTIDDSADYTTNSTSFIDVDGNFELTIETGGGDVMIGFCAMVLMNTSSTVVSFDVDIDGVRHGGDDGITGISFYNSGAFAKYPVSFVILVEGLDEGSHTFTLQWKCSAANTATLYAGAGTTNLDHHGQFWVREVS